MVLKICLSSIINTVLTVDVLLIEAEIIPYKFAIFISLSSIIGNGIFTPVSCKILYIHAK